MTNSVHEKTVATPRGPLNWWVLKTVFLPRQAVGLGAPQMIIRRPLT